jgi:RNA polymerase sigma-70 factor (ECF subfamily)
MSNRADEGRWVREARSGDLGAFWKLVERHGPMVRRLLQRLVGDRDRADDLFSETFMRASDRIDQFRGESKFSTWLTAIAINLAKNELKLEKRRSTLPWENVIPDEAHRHGKTHADLAEWADPHTILEQKELAELMERVVRQLPPKYRVVFVLRDVEGLSTEETAEALGLSITAVKSRAARARLALRKSLAPALSTKARPVTRA